MVDAWHGAAAGEPGLLDALDRRGRELRSGSGWAFWRVDAQRREAEDLSFAAVLLRQHSWQRLPYRYGRWLRVHPEPWEMLWRGLSVWKRTYETFQVLEPRSGRPVGEFTAPSRGGLMAPGGQIDLAGDLGTAVAYRVVGARQDAVGFATSILVDERAVRTGLAGSSSGPGWLPPPPRPAGLMADDDRRPWLIDQPTKPRPPRDR